MGAENVSSISFFCINYNSLNIIEKRMNPQLHVKMGLKQRALNEREQSVVVKKPSSLLT